MIKERVGVGMSVPERALVAELKERNLPEAAVRKAISVMLQVSRVSAEVSYHREARLICTTRRARCVSVASKACCKALD